MIKANITPWYMKLIFPFLKNYASIDDDGTTQTLCIFKMFRYKTYLVAEERLEYGDERNRQLNRWGIG
jgi:hypothetical protein